MNPFHAFVRPQLRPVAVRVAPIHNVIVLAVVLVAGCTSRTVPSSFPPAAAASPEAPPGARMAVTLALDGDPPLPSEPDAERWTGLKQPATSGHHHDDDDAHPLSGEPSAVYVCPMHPDVISDHAGRCPKCGMTLEMKP